MLFVQIRIQTKFVHCTWVMGLKSLLSCNSPYSLFEVTNLLKKLAHFFSVDYHALWIWAIAFLQYCLTCCPVTYISYEPLGLEIID